MAERLTGLARLQAATSGTKDTEEETSGLTGLARLRAAQQKQQTAQPQQTPRTAQQARESRMAAMDTRDTGVRVAADPAQAEQDLLGYSQRLQELSQKPMAVNGNLSAYAQGAKERYEALERAMNDMVTRVQAAPDPSRYREEYTALLGQYQLAAHKYRMAAQQYNTLAGHAQQNAAAYEDTLRRYREVQTALDNYTRSNPDEGEKLLAEADALPEAYRSIPLRADYRERSVYTPTGTGQGAYNHLLQMWTDTGYADPVYEYVNGNTDAITKTFSNESVRGDTLQGLDSRFLRQINPTERSVYNYLYATQGKDAATGFLLDIQSELNALQRKADETEWAAETQKGGLNAARMSAFSTLTKPLSMFSYAQQAQKALSGDAIDPNAGYNRGVYVPNTIRQTRSTDIEKKWGPVGSYAYNLGMSMSDFLYTAAITGGMEPLTLAVMGTEAAADTVLAAKERGLSDERSFITGTIAGLIEAATEHIGFDALFKTDIVGLGKAGFAKFILRNAGAEAGEEGAADIFNWIADGLYDVVSGTKKSEFKRIVSAYEENGLDHNKAVLSAVGDRAKELGMDMLGGFLSGLFLSGAKSGINAAEFNRIGKQVFDSGNARAYVGAGLDADLSSDAYQYAKEIKAKLDTNQKVTNIEMGQLAAAIYDDAVKTQDAKNTLLGAVSQRLSGQNVSNRTVQEILNSPQALNLLAKGGWILPSDDPSRAGAELDIRIAIDLLARDRAIWESWVNPSTETETDTGVPLVAIPERSTPEVQRQEEYPAWYEAYRQSLRQTDMPVQQRPEFQTPQQMKQAQEAPNLLATAEPARAEAPQTQQELTPAADTGIVKENTAYTTEEGRELANALNAYNRIENNGIEYTVNQTSAGWIGHLRRISNDRFGGMIRDARALDYQTGPMETRQEAVDTLIQVAERNSLLWENPGHVVRMSPEEEARLRAEEAALKGDTDGRQIEGSDKRGRGQAVSRSNAAGERAVSETSTRGTGKIGPADNGSDESGDESRADRLRAAAISPHAGSREKSFAEQAIQEYGITTYTVPASVWEQFFGAGDNIPNMSSNNGDAYIEEGISQDDLECGVPHEATHIMKQVGYEPYIRLLNEVPNYLAVPSDASYKLFEAVVKHIHKTPEDVIDYPSDTEEDRKSKKKARDRLYDEYMAIMYGHAINGQTKGDSRFGYIDFNDIFSGFDELFSRLKKIHEDFKVWNKTRLGLMDKVPQGLTLPTAEETLAPEPAKMTLPTVEKEETDNGGNNGGVDSGRQNIRGGKPGPGGLSKAGEEPEAGGSVSGSGNLRAGNVQPDERNAGQPGTRSGRSDDSVRSEQGGNAGHAGTADGQAVSGVAGEDAGNTEPGRLGGTDESSRSAVTRAKPRNRNNYRITEDIDSKRPNFNDNIAAIKLMKELLKSGRKPTAEDQAVLAKYKGWGALKDILLENSYYGMTLKNLLTEEEYNAAKLSVLNAHYTSTKVISAVYDAVKRLGFTGGRVLEPSMGVGNFFGMMPDKLSRASDLYGVELDSITGNIAKLLYPDAKIDVAGFQDVLYPDDTFDLVIGNVPFSNDVKVPYRNKTYNLHDFFFIKALDETRPGGIVALITSTGTLDKMDGKTQKAIADRANLIAAFRLPNDTFKTNAGTEVTTDLIFLQKKGPGIEDNGIEFQKRGKINDIEVNEYYVAHPKNILGTLAQEHVYSKDSWTTVVIGNGEDMQAVLTNAFKTLPKNIMNPGENTGLKLPVVAKKRGERSKASFTVNADGSVTITDSKTGEIIEYGNATKAEKDKAQTIKDYIGLKNTFLELLETENNGGDGSALRERLNRQYDDFVKKHKYLSDKANKKLLSPDGDYIRTTGIEVKAKEGYEKSDIFRVPTVSKVRKNHADSAEEALSIVLNENGKVDLKRMAELTGRTEKQLLDDLDEEIIQTPDGDYQLIAQYASGNIYKKLDQIKDRPGFDRQRKILEAALPRRRGAGEIEATIGSHWIAPEYVQDFIRDTFETNATVQFSKELGKWALQMGWTGVRRFSTNSVSTAKIVEATLNGKNVEVYDRMPDGGKVLNETETKLAQAKQEDLREAFRNWAFKDSKRAEALIDSYNRNLNAVAPMNYEALADRLDFGVNPNSRKQPRPYQKAAAARIVFGGNTLLHNGVGTGKTLTMILAARMLKQAGIAQKPMFVVPNGKVEDFRSEILEAYPDAKILAIDDDAMTPKQVQSTKTQIATGDWDFVIIYRTAFQRIPLSPELEAQMLQRQVDMYESAARDMAGERNGKKSFEKGLQARLETLRNRIKKVLDKPHDDTTYFDDMGVDALFVDEAHNYKKVGFPTSFQFSGIVADTNDITTDLYMKEELMRDRGNRIVLATATPITNAISEMYNMAMHVAPEVYQDAGIYSFDTWANTFVNIESQPEIASDGKTYRRKERARNFKNANALFGLYRQFADIKQTKDVVADLPKAETITIKSKASDLHKQILTYLSGLPVDKTLQMNNDGKNAAVDLRLAIEVLREMGIEMTPEELDLPGSKINRAVEAIIDEYHKSQDVRGTQFVFLDVGVNSEGKRYHFNLYDDLVNKLAKNGIPKEEIAKIGDYDGEDERQVLYEKMNNGEIRVLIGSTAKMGEGVNAQRRAVALHHLSVPYRPDNLEQREGRIVRSGNINKNVRIYRYIQEESYDSYLWQMIERKAAYLAEAYNGGDATEVDELSEAQVNAREAKAIATGNPIITEKMNLQDKIAKLKILQRGWQGEQHDATRNLEKARAAVIDASNKVKNAENDMETYQQEYQKAGEEFVITVGDKTYDNRKDATDALTSILAKKKAGKIGTVYGFEYGLRYDFSRNEYHLYALGENEYINSMGDSAAGNLTRILNLVEKGTSNVKTVNEQRIKLNESTIRDAQQTLKTPFKQKSELEEAQARMKEIDAELGISSDAEAVETGIQESRSAKPKTYSTDDQEYLDAEVDDVRYSRDTSNFNGNTAPRHPENWTATRVGDKNKTPMSVPDIVEMIRHEFDIPVSTGNIRSKDARAQYHRLPQSIRSKVADSIPDIAHELGHHLDNLFDIHNSISAAAKQEIIDAMPESFKAQYKKEQLPSEGVAEFLRRYLQNSEMADMDYPKFTEEFFGMLDRKAHAAIDKLADEVNAYYSLSKETGNWPIHNREDRGRDYRSWSEKLKDMNAHFRMLFVDSLEPIKQMEREIGGRAYLFASNAAYAGNRAYRAITGDLYDLRGNKLGVGLQKALEGIRLNNKREYTDFGMYLVCRQGPDRLKIGRVFGDDSMDSTTFMQQTEHELAEKYPAFEEAADRLYEFLDELLQAYGVESGLYSQETIDEWKEKFGPYYVPINRWFGDQDGNAKGQKRGYANQKGPFKQFRGSGRAITNPVDNIMENTVRLITTSIYNEVMQEITKAAANTEGSGRWLEKVPVPLASKTWDGKGIKAKTLEEFESYFEEAGKPLGQESLDLIQKILDGAIDDVLTQYTRGKAHGDIVTVMKNGKPEYWKVNDPDLLRSVTNMGPTRAGELLNYYGRVTRFITGNITGMNIVWSIASNMPRDIGTMLVFSRTKNIVKLLSGIGESYVNKFRGDKASELYKEFMAMGGISTGAQTADKDMAKKARKAAQKQKADWLNPLEWVDFVSDMIESGPRYAYYKICRTKYNMTPEEAFYAAMEITVNFKKAGLLGKEINILVPFFNAGVQGVDRMARWLQAEDLPEQDRKAGRTRRIAAYLGASLALAALSMALNARTKKKQKDLEKLSNYTKNNYFVIQLKNGKYLAIPKPRELAIPTSLFERIFEAVLAKNPNAFDDFWEYATDNLLPGVVSGVAQGDLNSAIGDLGLFGTLHYLVSNQDFLGRPIVSAAMENLEPKDQYNQNTSKLAKLIGQAFNLSPQQIDFLGNNMFGGFWQWQKALAPVSGNSDPTLGVASKWIKDPLYSTDIANRMYDLRDRLEKQKNSHPQDIQIAAEYRTVRDVMTFYGKYYGLAKNEPETEHSREVREAMLDLILGVEQGTNSEPARKFLLDVVEREGSTDYMPAVLDTALKGDDGYVQLNSEEYFLTQTRYEALYYNYIRLAVNNRPSLSDAEKTATVEAAKKIAGIVARGEAIEAHGGTYEAYDKVKDLLDDGVEEGNLINYLSARDLADADGSGKVSNSELLLAAGKLNLPPVQTVNLLEYSNPSVGRKLGAMSDYGVDATEYGKVLEALGDQSLSQEHVEAAIDAVYGRTTPQNRKEKAAMWQAMNKSWKSDNNPYDTITSAAVQNTLQLP